LAQICALRRGAYYGLLAGLLSWMTTTSVGSLAVSANEPPPPQAFLNRLEQRVDGDAYYVFAHPLWPMIHYGRLRDPWFPDAREEWRLESLPADRPVLVLEDLTAQPCPRPEGTTAGWEWIEPGLGTLQQQRYARLFLSRPSVVYGIGWWTRECLGAESWRWMGPEAELYLAPAPQGGELLLRFEAPEPLLGAETSVELSLGSHPSEVLLDRFSPRRFQLKRYRLGRGALGSGAWTKLRIRVTGAPLEQLPWDGRHRNWVPFRLALRVDQLGWAPKQIDESPPMQ
jgi:hypothetical protein